jgi:predicted flap endonuclease-1-like 5' DNA nuclease
MAIPINKLAGMTSELAAKLEEQGIHDSDQLLDAARTPADRRQLAKQTGVETQIILELADRSSLARIHGVGGVLSDLLVQIGVKTVKELATRRADHLHDKLSELIDQKKIKRIGKGPSLEMIQHWIDEAKAMPKFMEY